MKEFARLFLIVCMLSPISARSQDTLFVYPSMAEVAATVSASVAFQNDLCQYSYGVANGITALQKIWIFMVCIKASIQDAEAPASWDASTASRPTVTTAAWGGYDSSHFISPGGSLDGFKYSSSGLPKIQTFFAVGRIEPPEGEFLIAPGSNDIFINSAQGRTIGPADPPTPFDGRNFLDTIKSYINQSRSLGWIVDQTTANKYSALIDSARTKLQANKIALTRARLDTVLMNVHTDSSGHLTSEAYTLLRFNAEYVLKKLREEEGLE